MNVGDYGRTEEGKIIKIEELEDIYTGLNEFITTIAYFKGGYISVEHVIKSSPNIIDLIEVGDYVNGCPVLHKENNELVCGLLLRYKGKDIKSIVTHEQFSEIEYKVGE